MERTNIMKKLLCVILSLCLLGAIVGCASNNSDGATETSDGIGTVTSNGGGENNETTEMIGDNNETTAEEDGDNTATTTGETDNGGETTPEASDDDNTSDGEDQINVSRITDSTVFSEGYAFVNLDKDLSKEYCIDKQGKVIFTLNVGVHGETTGFYNGLCLYGSDWQKYALCDTTGKIITAEDLGGTNILYWDSEAGQNYGILDAFAAGYIFVEKTETTFEGSTTTAALYNAKLEKIVDFSEELYTNYDKFKTGHYYDGYLYVNFAEALDLRTGQVVTASEDILASLHIAHPSDFWIHKNDGYVDMLSSDSAPVIDLSKYAQTLSHASEFEDGEAYLIFNSNGVIFFTVLLENGELAFDPVEVNGSTVNVKRDDGHYAVIASGKGSINLYTFDKTGKIAEQQDIVDGSMSARLDMEFAEDVVLVSSLENGITSYTYYKLDLTPLFG